MKSAKEMFEELGLTERRVNDTISYFNHGTGGHTEYWYCEICFNLTINEYYLVCNVTGGRFFVDVKLHKAITKQLEELGWLEE